MAGGLQGKRNGRARYRPLAEINVTPMVDVMLVLLVIFMVTAPLLTSGVPVDLPKVSAKPVNSDSEPLTVSVNAEGKIYLQEQVLELPDLVAKLKAISKDNAERRIFVRGDKTVAYGTILQVMGTITVGGFTKVALLAEQPAPGTTPTITPTAPAASKPSSAPATPPAAPAKPAPGKRPG